MNLIPNMNYSKKLVYSNMLKKKVGESPIYKKFYVDTTVQFNIATFVQFYIDFSIQREKRFFLFSVDSF